MQGAGFGIRVHRRMLGAELRRNLEGIVREPRGKPLLPLFGFDFFRAPLLESSSLLKLVLS